MLSDETVGPTDDQLAVRYQITAHSAESNADYVLENGFVAFASGELTKNITAIVSWIEVLVVVE